MSDIKPGDIVRHKRDKTLVRGERQINRGDKYRPVVTVIKVKRGVPTIIRVSGREYVLRTPDQFNMQPKPRRGERNVQ